MKAADGALVPGPGSTDEVALMNLDGTGFRQLTSDSKFTFFPHFSPEARKIAYTKYSVGHCGESGPIMDFADYDFAGVFETVITHEGRSANAAWSPDGSRIANLNSADRSATRTVAPDGSSPAMSVPTRAASLGIPPRRRCRRVTKRRRQSPTGQVKTPASLSNPRFRGNNEGS